MTRARAGDAPQSERADRGGGRSLSGRHPYRADDPELLLWVLFTLVDSALVVYRKYVGALSAEQEAAYWEDYKVVGELFGLRRAEMPDQLSDLRPSTGARCSRATGCR